MTDTIKNNLNALVLTEPCAKCTKPANQLCSACKNHPDPQGTTSSIWYCSIACQTTHWKEEKHKKECKFRQDRLVLFRIGDTLQKLFYIYREKMFDKLIVRVEKKDGKLYVYEGVYGYERMALDFLYEFPKKVFDKLEEEDKLGVLVHSAFADVVVWFSETIGYLLSDIIADPNNDKNLSGLEEMNFIPRKIARQIISIDGATGNKLQKNQSNSVHLVIRVNMKDWSCFALDIAGAQHGWFEPVVSLKKYMDEKMQSGMIGAAKFGTLREQVMQNYGEGGGQIDPRTLNNDSASKMLKKELISWQLQEGNMMVTSMCKLDQRKFEGKQKEFLSHMEEVLEQHIEGERKRYFDAFEGDGVKPASDSEYNDSGA